MNIPQILQSVSKNLNQNQQNNLIQSINKAREALSLVQNPIESLAKNNISVEFLDNLKTYINNPACDWIFNILKKDKNSALQGIEAARQYLLNQKNNNVDATQTTNHQPSTLSNKVSTPVDDLDKFKRGLTRLK